MIATTSSATAAAAATAVATTPAVAEPADADVSTTTTTPSAEVTTTSTPPAAANKRPRAKVTRMTDLQPDHDIVVSAVAGSKVRVAKLADASGAPLLLQIGSSRGVFGSVHHSFGVCENELSKHGELTLTLVIDNAAELAAIERFDNYLRDQVVANRSTWYPKSSLSDEDLRKTFVPILAAPKARPDGSFYPRTLKSLIDVRDLVPRANGALRCKLRKEGITVDSAFALMGDPTLRFVAEYSCFYLGAKSFGVTNRVRILDCAASAEDLDVDAVSDDDDEPAEPASKRAAN